VGVGETFIEAKRVGEGRDRAGGVAVAITRERQLVAHARRAVVEPDGALVGRDRAGMLQLEEDVAKRFERLDGRRVEAGGGAEVARRGLEIAAIAASMVGLAAAEIGEHRGRPQGDRTAVGLDRVEGLIVPQGVVAAGQKHAVITLGHRLIGGRPGDEGQRQHGQGEDGALHDAPILPADRNFRARPGSNLV
jgi:hypothetical protein